MIDHIIGKNESLSAFCECLASSMPAPGGGGAAALCGALGVCLMRMVGSLTVGKKKYAEYEDEIKSVMAECTVLSERLLNLIEQDAVGFLPLANAYSISKDDPSRSSLIEQATLNALKAPMDMLLVLNDASAFLSVFSEKGSRLAVSDVGCAAALLRSAADAAILNVYINTKALCEQGTAKEINEKAEQLLKEIRCKADRVYACVSSALKGE